MQGHHLGHHGQEQKKISTLKMPLLFMLQPQMEAGKYQQPLLKMLMLM